MAAFVQAASTNNNSHYAYFDRETFEKFAAENPGGSIVTETQKPGNP